MKGNKSIGMYILVSILLCLWVGLGICKERIDLPREPIYRDQIIEYYIPYGLKMLWFGYDLDGDKQIDYWTGRTLVQTDAGLIAVEYPTYYGVDFNGDGEFDEMEIFIDVYQDGINGNEMLDSEYVEGLGM